MLAFYHDYPARFFIVGYWSSLFHLLPILSTGIGATWASCKGRYVGGPWDDRRVKTIITKNNKLLIIRVWLPISCPADQYSEPNNLIETFSANPLQSFQHPLEVSAKELDRCPPEPRGGSTSDQGYFFDDLQH